LTQPLKARTPPWSIILRAAVALLAVALLMYFGDWNIAALRNAFARLNPLAVAASILFFMLANLVIAARWSMLLRTQHIPIALNACVKVHFLGMFYNNILISSVGGDLLRAWYITKHTHKRLEAAFSVVVDRLVGLGSLILMAAGFYLLFPVPADGPELKLSLDSVLLARMAHYQFHITAAVVLLAFIVLGLLLYPPTRRNLYLAWAALWTRAQRLWIGTRLYAAKPLTMLAAVGLTFIAQSLPVLGFWLIGQSMSLPIPLKYYFVFFPISWVLGALPISPAGAGVLEGGIVFLFTRLPGVTAEDALVLAVCQRAMFLLGSLPGIVIHIVGAHLPRQSARFTADVSRPQAQSPDQP
jgi:uncharacterized protein (TIRG00374 family)